MAEVRKSSKKSSKKSLQKKFAKKVENITNCRRAGEGRGGEGGRVENCHSNAWGHQGNKCSRTCRPKVVFGVPTSENNVISLLSTVMIILTSIGGLGRIFKTACLGCFTRQCGTQTPNAGHPILSIFCHTCIRKISLRNFLLRYVRKIMEKKLEKKSKLNKTNKKNILS
jgi:hypothetical protein